MDNKNYTKMTLKELKYRLALARGQKRQQQRKFYYASPKGIDWCMTDYIANKIDEFQCLVEKIENIIKYKEMLNALNVNEADKYYFGD